MGCQNQSTFWGPKCCTEHLISWQFLSFPDTVKKVQLNADLGREGLVGLLLCFDSPPRALPKSSSLLSWNTNKINTQQLGTKFIYIYLTEFHREQIGIKKKVSSGGRGEIFTTLSTFTNYDIELLSIEDNSLDLEKFLGS